MPSAQLANGLKVHYQRVGEGEDLVMIHGIFGTLASWHLKIVPMLWDHFHMLTYDLRGHGYTELTETGYTPTELAEDLKQLMDVLEIEKAGLVGHSFGADVALYMAYLYPERVTKAVLIEPLVPAVVPIMTREDFDGREWVADLLTTLGVPIPDDRRLDAGYMLQQTAKIQNRWGPTKDMKWRTGSGSIDTIEKMCATTSILKDAVDIGDLTLEAIPTISVPIHLIFDEGSLSWHKSYQYLMDQVPDIRSSLINIGNRKLSHFALFESPDLVADKLFEALIPESVPPPPAPRRGRRKAS